MTCRQQRDVSDFLPKIPLFTGIPPPQVAWLGSAERDAAIQCPIQRHLGTGEPATCRRSHVRRRSPDERAASAVQSAAGKPERRSPKSWRRRQILTITWRSRIGRFAGLNGQKAGCERSAELQKAAPRRMIWLQQVVTSGAYWVNLSSRNRRGQAVQHWVEHDFCRVLRRLWH